MPEEFRRTLTDSDFTLDTETVDGYTCIVLVAATWRKIGTFTVPKGIRMAVGQRFDAHFYASFEDSATDEISAIVRISVSDPTEYDRRPVAEFTTDDVTAQTKDKKLQPYAKITPIWVRGDSKIIVEALPLETRDLQIDVSDKTSCEFRVPVTFKKE